MPKRKMDMSMRYPTKNRGINGNGSNASGGGGTGRSAMKEPMKTPAKGMGMAARKGSGKNY